ncbi:HAD-IA family hydrolase [Paenibacillus tarimensis]
MFRVVIFDFDGTLVQSRDLAIRLFNHFADKYRYRTMKEGDIQHLATLSIKNRLKLLGCPMYKLPMLLIDMKKKYRQDVIGLDAVSGIQDVLIRIKQQGIAIGILSSNNAENIHSFLELNDLKLFDFVFTASNLFGKDKAISRLMKDKGISNLEMLYIGDEIRDVEACKKMNVPCAAVTWGFDAEDLLAKGNPEFLIHHPEDILEVVRSV